MSVVVIPKSAVLSTRSCTLADHIPHAPYGHDATLTLALALYSEQCVFFEKCLIVPYCLSGVPTPYNLSGLSCARLLLYRSRWAGYLQSLPKEQNWHGIALFWGAALRDPLSSPDTTDDGRRVESDVLDPDGDAVEARRWLRGTEAETHLLLPDPPRTPLLVCPFTGLAVTGSPSRRLTFLILYDVYRTIFRASTLPRRRPFSSVWAYPHPREDFSMPMRSLVLVHSWLTRITAWPWCPWRTREQ